mgnify:FL=1
MAMSGAQKTEMKTALIANVNEVDKDGILTTLGKQMLGDNNIKDIARAKVLADLIDSGAMTAPEITELNTLLTREGEEVDEGGLLRDAEKLLVGATQISRMARVRILMDLLETIMSASVSPSVSSSVSPSVSTSASASPSVSASVSPSRSSSVSPSPSASPSVSNSPSPSVSPSQSSSRSPSVSPSASPSTSASYTPSASPSVSPSVSPSPSASPSRSPSVSPSASPSESWSS